MWAGQCSRFQNEWGGTNISYKRHSLKPSLKYTVKARCTAIVKSLTRRRRLSNIRRFVKSVNSKIPFLRIRCRNGDANGSSNEKFLAIDWFYEPSLFPSRFPSFRRSALCSTISSKTPKVLERINGIPRGATPWNTLGLPVKAHLHQQRAWSMCVKAVE